MGLELEIVILLLFITVKDRIFVGHIVGISVN
jgi:hypothetical protein